MEKSCAFIVIDSGFSIDVLRRCARILAAWDLSSNRKFEFSDPLSSAQLEEFAGDPLGHGSIVLARLIELEPDASFILVKAFANNDICRTVWQDSKIVRPGWTEAYVWAVQLARSRGMVSVANCSFGGYQHAMDGTGWEAFQLASVSGPGHAVLAAAGPGDGRALRGSFRLLDNEAKTFELHQEEDCDYNLWFGLDQSKSADNAWALEAKLNGFPVYKTVSSFVPKNFWNNRQQLCFRIYGTGRVQIEIARFDKNGSVLGVDAWAEKARFRNWVSPELIAEPACFPTVISVGLQSSIYSPWQNESGRKPEILLPGSGQISFRLPEEAVRVARILCRNPHFDFKELKSVLNKFPS